MKKMLYLFSMITSVVSLLAMNEAKVKSRETGARSTQEAQQRAKEVRATEQELVSPTSRLSTLPRDIRGMVKEYVAGIPEEITEYVTACLKRPPHHRDLCYIEKRKGGVQKELTGEHKAITSTTFSYILKAPYDKYKEQVKQGDYSAMDSPFQHLPKEDFLSCTYSPEAMRNNAYSCKGSLPENLNLDERAAIASDIYKRQGEYATNFIFTYGLKRSAKETYDRLEQDFMKVKQREKRKY